MSVRILVGDVRARLKELADESVHCVVTSPPYFGLRSYLPEGHPDKHLEMGNEATPAEFVAALVEVFREVRRVMRPDATLWLNLGDSYTSGGRADYGSFSPESKQATHASIKSAKRAATPQGPKPKDLIGIPWRVAFALQADGWYLRQDIIWSKPNPMPESVTDRCTKAHEYLFLLSKSERYYYDATAIAEDAIYSGLANQDESGFKAPQRFNGKHKDGYRSGGRRRGVPPRHAQYESSDQSGLGAGRNKRSVWEIATAPYPDAHFATFPPKLVEPCIMAGTSEKGCCPKCMAPWERQIERSPMVIARSERVHDLGRTRSSGTMVEPPRRKTVGWEPGCRCDAGDPVPCTVLEPFLGSGTALMVADRLGRNGIGIELNPDGLAERRIKGDSPLFTDVA